MGRGASRRVGFAWGAAFRACPPSSRYSTRALRDSGTAPPPACGACRAWCLQRTSSARSASRSR
eukprot:1829758-Prymnesium_polylepis.1